MERLKKGVAAFRNGAEHAGARLSESVKETLSVNPVHPKQLGTAMMERIHEPRPGCRYVIGGRTMVQERQLNEGGFAFVYLARDIHTDEELVLKKIPCQDKASILMARREVEILERLPPHPNLVKYYGHTIDKAEGNAKEVVLVFELCPGGHLLDLLELHQCRLSEAKILEVFTDVCAAVCLLHARSPPVQHRDLKVENILLGSNGNFKLCDFGSWSDECSNPANMDRIALSQLQENIERYTTMMYRPPEMVDFYQQFDITEKVDIWMLGCILFTLMFCRHPFQDESTLAISNARYDIPQEPVYSDKLRDLTHWLLARDPKNRPSAQQICYILDSFDDGNALDLPVAVVDQKERHRRLFGEGCVGQDMDAPLRLPSKKKDRTGRERRAKEGSSSKHRAKPHKERSRQENLATWGDVGCEAWPSSSVPQPSCDWAAFGSASSEFTPRPPEGHRDPTSSWTAWDLPPGRRTSAGSTAPSHQQDKSFVRQTSWPENSPGRNRAANISWDPFGNSAAGLASSPRGPPQVSTKAGFTHDRGHSWPSSPDPSLPSRGASLWPFDGASEGSTSSSRRPPRRAKTAPPTNTGESPREWSLSAKGEPVVVPASNGSPWPLNTVTPSSPRSPWDLPSGTIPTPVANSRPGEGPPLSSQGPWTVGGDPFDWLRSGPVPPKSDH